MCAKGLVRPLPSILFEKVNHKRKENKCSTNSKEKKPHGSGNPLVYVESYIVFGLKRNRGLQNDSATFIRFRWIGTNAGPKNHIGKPGRNETRTKQGSDLK